MPLHTNKHLVCECSHLLAIKYYLCLLLGDGRGGGGFGVGAITAVVVVTVVAIIVILILIVAIVVLAKRRLVLVSCLTHTATFYTFPVCFLMQSYSSYVNM